MVEHLGSEEVDAAVVMLLVVPGKEGPTEVPGLLDGGESVGEVGPILECFELGL
jgi:hypothetical protein